MSGLKAISSNRKLLLDKSLKYFEDIGGLTPKFGVELEFYLLGAVESLDDFILALQKKLSHNKAIYKIEKEQGKNQIEVKISHEVDLEKLCEAIDETREVAQNLALENNLTADFSSLPFIDDCPSAMQFNFSLVGVQNFEPLQQIFSSSIAAMLEYVDFMIIFCAPNEKDYLRFDKKINLELHKKGKYNAPTNICYGDNNRTALVRIPRSENKNKRIEFRLPSASADQYLVLAALLISLAHGIKENLQLNELKKIFGNAFDEQYKLKEFAKSLNEAEKNFYSEENFIRRKLEEFSSCHTE